MFNNRDFIDKECDFSKYTNEIGCLLGRWLDPNNRHHLNTDYYRHYKDNDEVIGKSDNVFISRYRDKKTFIVFSSLLTLILQSDKYNNKEANDAAKYTTNSVLSYLEFSRIRLHNALWLNKQLDRLVDEVEDVNKRKTTTELLASKNKLNDLKIKVAKSMNNLISYMWDTVLGQEIPSLKINKNVEKLENDTIQKLNLINELISDMIKSTQISDFSNFISNE